MFVKIQLVAKLLSKNLGLRILGRLVPSTLTFGSKLNSFVHVEKIDVVGLSFDNEKILPVRELLRLLR